MTEAWQEVNRIIQSALDKGLKEGRDKGLKEGRDKGLKEGEILGLRQNIQDLCQIFGISLGSRRRAQLHKMDLDRLRDLRAHLMAHRAWPS